MSQPSTQNPTVETEGRSNNLLFVYFSIIILTVLVFGILPFFVESMTLENRELITQVTSVVLGLSQLLIPFTVKDKKRRMIALIFAIAVAAFFVVQAL